MPPNSFNLVANQSIDDMYQILFQKLEKQTGSIETAYYILDRLDPDQLQEYNSTFTDTMRKIKVLSAGQQISKNEFLYLLLTKIFKQEISKSDFDYNLNVPNYGRSDYGQQRYENAQNEIEQNRQIAEVKQDEQSRQFEQQSDQMVHMTAFKRGQEFKQKLQGSSYIDINQKQALIDEYD